MKPHGAENECRQERNNELMKVYHRLICDCDYVNMPTIYAKVAESPSPRFWVSEERAAIVLASIRKGDTLENMRPNNREMFRELYKRAQKVMRQHPRMTLLDVAFIVVRQPAPKFYLTPGSAKVIICNAKKKWYEERKRKLRHLFW